jgi:hypothetical protein
VLEEGKPRQLLNWVLSSSLFGYALASLARFVYAVSVAVQSDHVA